MTSLAGLTVLVTRPEPQASRWAWELRARGATPLVAPLMTLEAVSDSAARQAVKNCVINFDLYQKAIFVSQNAVAHAFEWLDQYWPQLPLGVEYFGVGERTASALAEQGVRVTARQSSGAMNSEALLTAPELRDVTGQRIVIFRGVDGRGLMGDTLRARGAQVDYCELYERHSPVDAHERLMAALAKAGNPRPDQGLIVALHSAESLDNYHRARLRLTPDSEAAQRLAVAPLLVAGERVAQHAAELGYPRIVTAENATDPAMLAALDAALKDPVPFQTNGPSDRRNPQS